MSAVTRSWYETRLKSPMSLRLTVSIALVDAAGVLQKADDLMPAGEELLGSLKLCLSGGSNSPPARTGTSWSRLSLRLACVQHRLRQCAAAHALG